MSAKSYRAIAASTSRALSTPAEDLTGMKLYLLQAPGRGQQDAVLIWFAKFAQEWVVVPATPTVKAHCALQAGTRPK